MTEHLAVGPSRGGAGIFGVRRDPDADNFAVNVVEWQGDDLLRIDRDAVAGDGGTVQTRCVSFDDRPLDYPAGIAVGMSGIFGIAPQHVRSVGNPAGQVVGCRVEGIGHPMDDETPGLLPSNYLACHAQMLSAATL
ncbi:hypothetical protein ACWCPQ_26485 [Nocardia sp. NPDC001965]